MQSTRPQLPEPMFCTAMLVTAMPNAYAGRMMSLLASGQDLRRPAPVGLRSKTPVQHLSPTCYVDATTTKEGMNHGADLLSLPWLRSAWAAACCIADAPASERGTSPCLVFLCPQLAKEPS